MKSVDPRRIDVGGEIAAGWDVIASTVAETLRREPLIGEVGAPEILTVGLGEQRLRGAAALVGTSAFAAPVAA